MSRKQEDPNFVALVGSDDGTNIKGISIYSLTDSEGRERLAVDANISFAPELSGGDPFDRTDDRTYGDGATVDAISVTVSAGKIVYIQDIIVSRDIIGGTASKYELIRDNGGETVLTTLFTDTAVPVNFSRAFQFTAGQTIILRVTNNGGLNARHAVTIKGAEGDA